MQIKRQLLMYRWGPYSTRQAGKFGFEAFFKKHHLDMIYYNNWEEIIKFYFEQLNRQMKASNNVLLVNWPILAMSHKFQNLKLYLVF